MKRTLLLATAAIALGVTANAQLVEESSYSPNLKLEWYASPEAAGSGFDARSGVGTNGKFYVTKHKEGVYIFDKNGLVKKIANPTAWVSINCDDAGHVYFRNDGPSGFPGPEGAGWFVTADAHFCVIDAATDEVIKTDVPIIGGGKCRFDALPHILGDMTSGEMFELSAPVNATAQRIYNWIYNGLDEPNTFEEINLEWYFNSFPYPGDGSFINTIASAQHYDADHMAVLPNPNIDYTYAGAGWGNCIAQMVYDEDEYAYVPTNKFFKTPNHSGCSGFCMFNYNGDNYIVYPTGQQVQSIPSADGFAVMKETLIDEPTNEVPVSQEDLDSTVAIHFATEGLASGYTYRGINVEPVEGEDGKFTIYFYSPGVSMQVWTLDLSGADGINDISVDKADLTPVYYNMQGVKVQNPQNGVYVEVRGNKATKVVR